MARQAFDPELAFPEEVLEDLRNGVPEPVLYSGPLYLGDGSDEVEKSLSAIAEKYENGDLALAPIGAYFAEAADIFSGKRVLPENPLEEPIAESIPNKTA